MEKQQEIASYFGLAVPTVSFILQTYTAFKKSNVENFFQLLLKEKKDITSIGESEEFKKMFFRILDDVASESNDKKIEQWKNLVVKLATKLSYQDYLDNYLQIMEALTAFDLMVLFTIYNENIADEDVVIEELCKYYKKRGVPGAVVKLSVKKLAASGLLDEMSRGIGYSHGMPSFVGSLPRPFSYYKNEMGVQFLEIISD